MSRLKKGSLFSLFIILVVVSSGIMQVSQVLGFPVPQVSAPVSFVAHAPTKAQASPGYVTITGYLSYLDNGNREKPIRYATINLYDKTWYGINTLLSSTWTNSEGYYQFPSIENSDELGGSGTLDIYIEIVCDSGAVKVVPVLPINIWPYSWQSSVWWDIPDGTWSMSIYGIAGPNIGCWGIYDSIIDAYQQTETKVGYRIPKITVVWPWPWTHFANLWILQYIGIESNFEWNDDAVCHEYGHWVMHCLYQGNVPPVDYGSDERHYWDSHETQETAWVEGWANFYSCAIRGDRYFWEFDLEDEWPKGDDVEGAIAGILWDIYDSSNDGHDTLSSDIEEIWFVLRYYTIYGHHVFTIHEFWDGFIENFCHSSLSKQQMWEIYYDHGIDKDSVHARFSPLIDGYSFHNLIPKESVSFWDALEAISSASWSSSVPSAYWPILAWLSVAVHNLQFGNCFGMSYTAKYYYQNPLLFVSNYPSYGSLYEVDMSTASPEIVTNQFPGQLIISPYLINIAIISLGLSSLSEQIPWILSQLDDYNVVQLYLARPVLDSNILHVFHSVLVYDYELVGSQVRLHVYDPNHGGDTRYIVLSKDEYENYEIVGGNAIIEYDVTQIAAGEFHDMGWSLLAGYRNELVQLVYDLVTSYCDDFLGFEAKSPVNMLVTAPDGLRVGYDPSTQSEVNEISGATYSGAGSEPQTILIPSPLLGNCTLDIFGTGTGDYKITVESKAPNGPVVKPLTLSGTASEGKLDTYSIKLTEEYTPIPEFPSFLILPLFMIATLLAVTVYRKKYCT